jgi:hypothetical protein
MHFALGGPPNITLMIGVGLTVKNFLFGVIFDDWGSTPRATIICLDWFIIM